MANAGGGAVPPMFARGGGGGGDDPESVFRAAEASYDDVSKAGLLAACAALGLEAASKMDAFEALKDYFVHAPERAARAAKDAVRMQARGVFTRAKTSSMPDCVVCLGPPEDAAAGGFACPAHPEHYLCREHLNGQAVAHAHELATAGGMPCSAAGCAGRLELAALKPMLDAPAAAAIAERSRGAKEGEFEAWWRAARGEGTLAERVALLRRVLGERDVVERCPRCATMVLDHIGCNAVTCESCGCGFCSVCLADCGTDAHAHIRERHAGELCATAACSFRNDCKSPAAHAHCHERKEHADYFDADMEVRARRLRVAEALDASVREVAGWRDGPALQLALVEELAASGILRDHGLSRSEVLLCAGLAAPLRVPFAELAELAVPGYPAAGAFGSVRVYRWAARGIDVAVKEPLEKRCLGQADAAEGLLREIQLQSALGPHHAVAAVLGAAVDAPAHRYGIAMLFFAGGSAADDTAVPLAVALERACKLAEGVAFLHSRARPVVHADVKPANLLLASRGGADVALSDFGLSRAKLSAGSTGGAGAGKGTPEFMAPELFETFPEGHARQYQFKHSPQMPSDVYALGVTVWCLAAGARAPPLPALEPPAQHFGEAARRGGRPPRAPLEALPPQLREGLWRLLEQCWAADAGQRPPAARVAALLRQLLRQLHRPDPGDAVVPALPGGAPGHYADGPGLALLFADVDEGLSAAASAPFRAARARLGAALASRGFHVLYEDSRNMLARARAVLAHQAGDPALQRVLVGYAGHGCLTDAHPAGLLKGRGPQYVRVEELQYEVAEAFRHRGAFPKLLVLDCCFGREDAPAGLARWEAPIGPARRADQAAHEAEAPHDMCTLRATSLGRDASAIDGFSLSTAVADVIEGCDVVGFGSSAFKALLGERYRLAGEEFTRPQHFFTDALPLVCRLVAVPALQAAGRSEDAPEAVFSLAWLLGRLQRVGWEALVRDLCARAEWERREARAGELRVEARGAGGSAEGRAEVAAGWMRAKEARWLLSGVRGMGEAGGEAGNFVPQLCGRLGGVEAAAVRLVALEAEARAWDGGGRAWLRPVRANFERAYWGVGVLRGHTCGVNDVCVLGGGRIVSASSDCTLRVWDTASGACERVLEGHKGGVYGVCALEDGRIVSASADKTLRVWGAGSVACERVLEGHTGSVRIVLALRDGRVVSQSHEDHTVRVWNVCTGACEWLLEDHLGFFCILGGWRIVSASSDYTLRMWDAATGACQRVLEGHKGKVSAVCTLEDGRFISASSDKTLRVWGAGSGACEWVLEGHTGSVCNVRALGGGRVASESYEDHTVRVWDATTGTCERVLAGRNAGRVNSGAGAYTLLDGRIVSLWYGDPKLRLWVSPSDSGACAKELEGHTRGVRSVCELEDGRIVSASDDNTLRVWDATTDTCGRRLEGHTDYVSCMCKLEDGRIISASYDKTLRVWGAGSGVCERVLEGHAGYVRCVRALGGGRVVSASDDNTLRVWDSTTGACERVLKGHTWTVGSVCVLESGRIVSASSDRTLRVWDTSSGECLRVLKGDYMMLCVLALGNERFVSASQMDYTMRVWDAATEKCLRLLPKHHFWSVNLLQGGLILSASREELHVWDAGSGACLESAPVGSSRAKELQASAALCGDSNAHPHRGRTSAHFAPWGALSLHLGAGVHLCLLTLHPDGRYTASVFTGDHDDVLHTLELIVPARSA